MRVVIWSCHNHLAGIRGVFRRRLPAEGTGRLTRQETVSRYSGEHNRTTIGYFTLTSISRPLGPPVQALLASTAMQLLLSRLDVRGMRSHA